MKREGNFNFALYNDEYKELEAPIFTSSNIKYMRILGET